MAPDEDAQQRQRFEIGPMDAGPIGPVDLDPTPAIGVEGYLRSLEAAAPQAAALRKHDYMGVVQALAQEDLSSDQANNLGYACAWLGYEQNDYTLWARALSAFETADQEGQTPEEHARAQKNLDLVRKALDARAAG